MHRVLLSLSSRDGWYYVVTLSEASAVNVHIRSAVIIKQRDGVLDVDFTTMACCVNVMGSTHVCSVHTRCSALQEIGCISHDSVVFVVIDRMTYELQCHIDC